MHTQTAFPFPTTNTVSDALADPARNRIPGIADTPRYMRSVVNEAGLGGYACLRGMSGRRYVFCAIKADQLFLYRNAVIALADKHGRLQLLLEGADVDAARLGTDSRIYVYLLDERDAEAGLVISDLEGVSN